MSPCGDQRTDSANRDTGRAGHLFSREDVPESLGHGHGATRQIPCLIVGGLNQAQFAGKTGLVAAVGTAGCPLIRFLEPLDETKTLPVAEDADACKAGRGERSAADVPGAPASFAPPEPATEADGRSGLDRDDAAAAAERPVTELQPSASGRLPQMPRSSAARRERRSRRTRRRRAGLPGPPRRRRQAFPPRRWPTHSLCGSARSERRSPRFQ